MYRLQLPLPARPQEHRIVPAAPEREEREELLVRHFASLGIGLFETAFTWWASPERFRRIVTIEGRENLQAHWPAAKVSSC